MALAISSVQTLFCCFPNTLFFSLLEIRHKVLRINTDHVYEESLHLKLIIERDVICNGKFYMENPYNDS